MKILKRTPLLKNLLAFLTLSVIYLHVTAALHKQVSAIEWEVLKGFFLENKLLLGFYLAAMWTTYKVKKSSKVFAMMFFSFVFGQTFYFFLISFDKLILLLNFTYLVFSFCFYLLWKLELDEAYYWPGFHSNDLQLVPDHDLPVVARFPRQGALIEGHLINWNETGAYIILKAPPEDLRGVIEVEVFYLGKTFTCPARVITSYGKAIGVRFQRNDDKVDFTRLSWDVFYDIIHDRGYRNRTVSRTS